MKTNLNISYIKGYAFGLSHPSLLISSNEKFSYRGCLGLVDDSSGIDSEICIDDSLLRLVKDYTSLWDFVAFSGASNFLFYSSSKVFLSNPFLPSSKAVELIDSMLKIDCLGDSDVRTDSVNELVKEAKAFLPSDQNTIHFLKAARELGISWRILLRIKGKHFIQYGEGARLSLMNSSLSDLESPLGVSIVKNKSITSQYLHSLGYPIQPHICVSSVDYALTFAHEQFPVVVKPVGADRGEGVEVDIRTENDLKVIAESLLKQYKTIMVEKYISAIDYRLYVFQGQLIWAHRRVPPRLTGDGVKSISKLLEVENLRRLSADSSLKPIPEDRNFSQCLEDQGLNPDSILPLGISCKVGSLGLVSRGGHTEACYGEVHPDNAELAIDCCRQVGICLGGVDLLIPDISISWRKSVAHICEINAVPQLGTMTQSHLYKLILESLVKNKCLPSILIILASGSSYMESLRKWLSDLSLLMGFHIWSSWSVSNNKVNPLFDRRADSCVALMRCEDVFTIGAPLMRFDQVFVDQMISNSVSANQLKCFSQYCTENVLTEFESEESLKTMLLPALSLLYQRKNNFDSLA